MPTDSLTRTSVVQTFVTAANRLLGLITLSLIYHTFDLSLIGNYFYLIGLLTLTLAIAHLGSNKILVKLYVSHSFNDLSTILSTKALMATILAIVFLTVAYTSTDMTTLDLLSLAICIPVSALTYDFVLIARKRFLSLGLYLLFAQSLVIAVLSLAAWRAVPFSITVHQILPTLLLFILIYLATRSGDPNIEQIQVSLTRRPLIGAQYFQNHSTLLMSSVMVGSISAIDYTIGKIYLTPDQLGIYSGLLRFSTIIYSFMITINSIFFTYSITNRDTDLRKSKLVITTTASVITFFGYIILIQPYLKLVMGIEHPSEYFLSAALMLIGSISMPFFFLYLNTLETSDSHTRLSSYRGTLAIGLLIYLLGLMTSLLLPFNITPINLVAFLFTFKWLILMVAFHKIDSRIQLSFNS